MSTCNHCNTIKKEYLTSFVHIANIGDFTICNICIRNFTPSTTQEKMNDAESPIILYAKSNIDGSIYEWYELEDYGLKLKYCETVVINTKITSIYDPNIKWNSIGCQEQTLEESFEMFIDYMIINFSDIDCLKYIEYKI